MVFYLPSKSHILQILLTHSVKCIFPCDTQKTAVTCVLPVLVVHRLSGILLVGIILLLSHTLVVD